MPKRTRGVPKGVDKRFKRLADGTFRTYWFVRALGLKEGRLQGAPGDAEFHAEYARKIAGLAARNAPDPNAATLTALITLYQASRDFTDLGASSKKDYGAALHVIREHFGAATRLRGVLDHAKMHAHIERWHEGMAATPRKADLQLAVLHKLLEFGKRKAVLDHNRASGIRRLYVSNRAKLFWTSEQIEKLCEVGPPEIGWVIRLAYVTGQRQGDLLALRWSQVSEKEVVFETSKTDVRIVVPMYIELAEVLAQIPKRAMHVLTGPGGRAWNAHTFRHLFHKACADAEVGEGLHFHDLRGTALKAFAEAGCSELELRAISGHSMKALTGALGSYIDAFRSLAESAVQKRENAYRTKIANQACKPEVCAEAI